MKNTNMISKLCTVVFITIATSLSAFSQSPSTISGTVTDTKGEAVAGAVVMLEGSNTVGSATDIHGKFTITLPAGNNEKKNLVASCLGYANLSLTIGKSSKMDFVLHEDNEVLDATVVIGYGAMRRSDLTGAVMSVKIDENEAAQSASLDQMLQGRAAGVQVVSSSAAPDAGSSVIIRGMSTFNGSNQPLYVVDGIIINTESYTASSNSTGQDNVNSEESTNGLIGINPSDIANIEILKDASASAIFGSQGANGVILITTKQATKDRMSIKFNAGFDISTPYAKRPVLDMYEFEQYANSYHEVYGKGLTPGTDGTEKIYNDKGELKVTPVDWQDYVMRTALSQRYYLSIAGRPKDLSYLLSLGYTKSEGIIRTTGFDNLTLRINLDAKITKNLKIGTKTSMSFLSSNLTQGASYGRLTQATSMIRSMTTSRPWINGVRDEDDPFDMEEDLEEYRSGPNRWLTDFSNKRQEFRITPSAYLDWNIVRWLSFKTVFGADVRTTEATRFKSIRINTTTDGSSGAATNTTRFNYNWDSFFTFNNKFNGGHSLTGTLGTSLSRINVRAETVEGANVEQYKAMEQSLNSAEYAYYNYAINTSSLLSFYVRAIYNYKDRYVLTATYRLDGSSKFKGANKWASFPSFAAAWRIHEEPWFNVPVISAIKLRAGWGQVGNQSITSYQTMSNYDKTAMPNHEPTNKSEQDVGLYPQNFSNENLKWETTATTNIGLDLAMWKGRLALTIDAYIKNTRDLLQNKTITGASGFTTMWVNMGQVQNKGLEFTLQATPVRYKGFEWSLGGNIGMNRNKLVKIGVESESADIYLAPGNLVHRPYFYGNKMGSGSYCNAPLNIFIEGEAMSLFYGYKTDGILQEGETAAPMNGQSTERRPGMLKYVDVDGDGVISDKDRVVIGNPNPKFTYGFNTCFSFKGITLNAQFVGSYGNDIFNLNRVMESNTISTRNQYKPAVYDAWTPAHPDASYYGIYKYTATELTNICDFFVEDGSYLRLSTIALNYDIPLKKKKTAILKGLNVGVTLSNPIVWTNYSGWDPDVNTFSSALRYGADMGSYPSSRAYRFDIKFTF